MLKDTAMSAAALYDGGWRAEDKDQLMTEHDLTEDEADAICEKLAEYAGQQNDVSDKVSISNI